MVEQPDQTTLSRDDFVLINIRDLPESWGAAGVSAHSSTEQLHDLQAQSKILADQAMQHAQATKRRGDEIDAMLAQIRSMMAAHAP